jgi:hypothetical protein
MLCGQGEQESFIFPCMETETPSGVGTQETGLAISGINGTGILNSRSKPTPPILGNTSENFDIVRHITEDKNIPHLMCLGRSGVLDNAMRDPVSRESPRVDSAMTPVSHPGKAEAWMPGFR